MMISPLEGLKMLMSCSDVIKMMISYSEALKMMTSHLRRTQDNDVIIETLMAMGLSLIKSRTDMSKLGVKLFFYGFS